MQYVIVILIIFGLQIFTFVTFELTQNGSYQEQKKIALLEKKIKHFEIEIEANSKIQDGVSQSRGVASVDSREVPTKNIDLGGFYFSRYKTSKIEGKNRDSLSYLNKIQKESVDQELVARATFLKIEESCRLKMSSECLTDFEFLIDQFPESHWTKNALLLLKDFYSRTNRKSEVLAIGEILKNEFGEGHRE